MVRRRIAPRVLLAGTLLTIATSTAPAATTGIGITTPRNNLIVATSVGKLTLAAGIIQTNCSVSLQLSLPSGLTAVTPDIDRLGRVVAAVFANCDLPAAFLEMPSMLGGSPNPTWGDIEFLSTDLTSRNLQNIRVNGFQFDYAGCLWRGNLDAILTGTISGNNGVATGMTSAGNPLPRSSDSLCPQSAIWLGSLTLVPAINYTLLP